MLISRPHKFIFVHIYKNAGTSITEALLPFAVHNRVHLLAYRKFKQLRLHLPFALDPTPLPKHSKADKIVSQLGEEEFGKYFSFAFVRNPWDWQVSLFNYVRTSKGNRHYSIISDFKDFDAYIRWRCSDDVHFQRDFVSASDGRLLVDFVGRYENLQRDFETVCSHVGIQTSVPRLNVSTVKPYQQYYTSDTVELVRNAFAPDIELFGYQFEEE
jgi:hypothetical protein